MKIKVCGMKFPENIRQVADLHPDYMGFIFYAKSKRNVADTLDEKLLKNLHSILKVGVFVNEEVDFIVEQADKFGFKFIQLHGDESPEVCSKLKQTGLKVIKAFSVDEKFNFSDTQAYKAVCDFFLFDTKGDGYGGTGKKFDWKILQKYDNEIPFFLSGGIDLVQVEDIKNLRGLNIHALDINSKFEIEPGLKDAEKVKKFIQQFTIRNAQS
jgi:phosphoribosylanthranilate isomerase